MLLKKFIVNVKYVVSRKGSRRDIERPLHISVTCDENDNPLTCYELNDVVHKYDSQLGLYGIIKKTLAEMEGIDIKEIYLEEYSYCTPV